MRKFLLTAAFTVLAGAASAATVHVAQTGIDANNDGIDDNYTLNGGAAHLVNPVGWGWEANNANSAWIGHAANPKSGNATRAYSISFDLTGFDVSKAVLSGRFWVDDVLDAVQVNGTTTALTNKGHWTFSNVFSGIGGFVSGMNTLTFLTRDTGGNVAGFRVGELSVDQVAPVPLPAALPMTLAGLGALGLFRRSRRRA